MRLLAAQSKMLKYATDNSVWCGIPPQVIGQPQTGHRQDVRDPYQSLPGRRGAAAASGPSLSDALTSPVPDSNNIKTGRGTFDTLTGSPLGK